MMLFLYDILFFLLFLLYLPFYLVHIIRRGGLTSEYWERFGFFSREKKALLRSLKHPVWIHAVSVGESIAAVTFIKAWQKAHPEDDIVLSCSTSTAFHTIRQKHLAGIVQIYCPFDFGFAIRHVLNLVRPRVLAIFEVEIWPNLVMVPARRGVKVCLVNGRMSDKSAKGYARWKCIFRPIFNAFCVLCVQTEEDAARLRRVIGDSDKIHVCDTMKFDQVPEPSLRDVSGVLNDCFGTEPRVVLVAGSTHSGEEALIADAYLGLRSTHPELKLVIVPRHVERSEEIREMLKSKKLTCRLLQSEGETGPADVLLVNTTGELMNFFAAGDIAFVGKSLAGQTGGHNIIEPAISGKAILYGSHSENFRAVVAIFQSREAALEVPSDEAFLPLLARLLENPEEREELGRRARATVERYRGAIDRTIAAIGE